MSAIKLISSTRCANLKGHFTGSDSFANSSVKKNKKKRIQMVLTNIQDSRKKERTLVKLLQEGFHGLMIQADDFRAGNKGLAAFTHKI